MSSKLPLRFRILHHFSQARAAMSSEELMRALKDEYGHEGQFKKAIFHEHLMSMRAGGLIEYQHVAVDSEGQLIQSFMITELGRSRLKYLPAKWKTA
jgi:DNA-binding PadR family transcriptional regulator